MLTMCVGGEVIVTVSSLVFPGPISSSPFLKRLTACRVSFGGDGPKERR